MRPHILKLLIEDRFPRLWRPSQAERDLRQLLIHRHRWVVIRTRVKNGLQHLMLNQGVQLKQKLRNETGQKVLRELPGVVGVRRDGSWQPPYSPLQRNRASDRGVDAAAVPGGDPERSFL